MTTLDNRGTDFRSELGAFLRLAVPLASAQFAQVATGFVDTVMMGRLGPQTLAAGALASMTFFACFIITSGVVAGASPLVAESYGAGNKKRIEKITRQGLWLSFVIAVPVMIVLAHLSGLMRQLGQAEVTIQLVSSYLNTIVWGLFPALAFAMLRGVISALSEARPVMVIVVLGTAFNILANYALGFGKLGFPRMELSGLALGSVLTFWLMFLALVVYLASAGQFKDYQFFRSLQKVNLKVLWEVTKLGAPIGAFYVLEIGVYTTISYLVGTIGIDELGAYQLGFQTTNLLFMVPLGMSFAVTARVGQWLGQKDIEGVRRAGLVSIFAGAFWTAIVSIILLCFPQSVVGLYIDIHAPENQRIVEIAVSILRIAAISHVFDGVQKIAYGALQGIQDTRIPALFSFLAYWCIGLVTGYWLAFTQNLGVVGFWIGLLAAVVVSAAFFLWRFKQMTRSMANTPFYE